MSVQRFSTAKLMGYKARHIGAWDFRATGGDQIVAGGYKIHTFSSTGADAFTVQSSPIPQYSLDILMVAGGGSARQAQNPSFPYGCGGGGAGAMVEITGFTAAVQTYPLFIGAGSSAIHVNGEDTTGFDCTVQGGGSGTTKAGNDGGSGAGGTGNYGSCSGGSSTKQTGLTEEAVAFGNGGGKGYDPGTNWGSNLAGGGGGGAGGGGGNAGSNNPGNGGAGRASTISGSSSMYAGGGAGWSYQGPSRNGGSGVGGNSGTSGQAGAPNTGSGGGAGDSGGGGHGGSGVVIIRYLI